MKRMRLPIARAVALLAASAASAASVAAADLLPYGDPIQVTSDPAATNYGVATAVQSDGSFLVAWTRVMTYPNGNTTEEVVEQTFDGTGAPRGAPRALDSLYGVSGASAVALPDGHYVVAWTRNLGPWAQVVDAGGAPLAQPVVLPGSPVDESGGDVRLAALPQGFAAIWKHSMPAGLDPNGVMRYSHTFFFRQFGEDGAPQGVALAVTSPSPPAIDYPEPSVADIAALPRGGFIVVWSQDLATVPPSTVQALVLDAQGIPATLAIDTDRFSGGMVPRVLVEPDGSCDFLWIHGGTLAVRRLDSSGLSPTVFSTAVQVDSPGFEAATDRHGHLLVTAGDSYGFFFGDLSHGLWQLDDFGHESAVLPTAMDTVVVTTSALAANAEGTSVAAWLGNGGNSVDHLDVFAHSFRSTCIPGGRQLCLGSNGRFALEADWQTPDGNQGPATPAPLAGDTGGFWFFSASNVELLAKVLDGRAVNGNFWVLWGGMTNVGVALRVTDTLRGSTRSYTNPVGDFPSMADVNAFPDPGPASAPLPPTTPTTRIASDTGAATTPACATTPTTLCLHGRFLVGLEWQVGANQAGLGQVIPATYDSGYVWFFAPGNVELAVKVLDGTAVNGHFWVFAASLSNVQFAITVTDTVTGAVRVYENPAGIMRSFGDTSAF
jgi:hypothetical protein